MVLSLVSRRANRAHNRECTMHTAVFILIMTFAFSFALSTWSNAPDWKNAHEARAQKKKEMEQR